MPDSVSDPVPPSIGWYRCRLENARRRLLQQMAIETMTTPEVSRERVARLAATCAFIDCYRKRGDR